MIKSRAIVDWMEGYSWEALKWDSLEIHSADVLFGQELLLQWPRLSDVHTPLSQIRRSDVINPLKILATHQGNLSWLLIEFQASCFTSLSELKNSVKTLTQSFSLTGDWVGSLGCVQLQHSLSGQIYEIELTPIQGQIYLRVMQRHPQVSLRNKVKLDHSQDKMTGRSHEKCGHERFFNVADLDDPSLSAFHSQRVRWKEDWEGLVQSVLLQNLNHGSDEDHRRLLHTWRGCFSLFKLPHLEDLCRGWEEKLQKNFEPNDFSYALREVQMSLERIIDLLQGEATSKRVRSESHKQVCVEEQALGESGLSSPQFMSWLNEVLVVSARQNSTWVYPIRFKVRPGNLGFLTPSLRRSWVHLIRNAVAHGIESPEEREALGKSWLGEITVQIQEWDDHWVMSLQDDGRGIDYQKIYMKAKSLGYGGSDSEQDLEFLVLSGGVSLSKKGSSLSGQGIGLACVAAEVRRLQGSIHLKKNENKGLEVQMRLPKKSSSIE